MDATLSGDRIREVQVHLLKLPLIRPYKVSQKSHSEFPVQITELVTENGYTGFGEAVISSGYTNETIDGGFQFAVDAAPSLVGKSLEEARDHVMPHLREHSHAVSTILCAIDMAGGHPLLDSDSEHRIPLLTPCPAETLESIPEEVEKILEQGFRTIKVKVGFGVEKDLKRVYAIRDAASGRAVLRLDANRAFSREDGCAFGAQLPDDGSVALFEQPCGTHDWDDNAAVAAVSTVPVMLDESIYGLSDIDRAAEIPGIGLIKVKLKKAGGVSQLHELLVRIKGRGMEPVLGDGVASEIVCWMEACIARSTIENAGEMNGYLKPKVKIFTDPLPFEDGALVLKKGYRPELDRDVLKRYAARSERIAQTLA